MKYIRTKDGIKIINIICDDGKHYCDSDWNIVEIDNDKVSDTIEELCDELVLIREDLHLNERTGNFEYAKGMAKQGFVVYGAIWTDRGLIYVAKMNDKGVLELL